MMWKITAATFLAASLAVAPPSGTTTVDAFLLPFPFSSSDAVVVAGRASFRSPSSRCCRRRRRLDGPLLNVVMSSTTENAMDGQSLDKVEKLEKVILPRLPEGVGNVTELSDMQVLDLVDHHAAVDHHAVVDHGVDNDNSGVVHRSPQLDFLPEKDLLLEMEEEEEEEELGMDIAEQVMEEVSTMEEEEEEELASGTTSISASFATTTEEMEFLATSDSSLDTLETESVRDLNNNSHNPLQSLPALKKNEEESDRKENNSNEAVAVASSASTSTSSSSSSMSDYPSIKKIVQFSLPAIGVWLCSPVLSMIDTASVGLLAGTAQQAALNPAVSVTDYGALLVAFMYTATTNLIAGAQEKDAAIEGSPRTTQTLLTALRLALIVGIFFGAVLGSSGKPLLKLLIGNDSLDPAVFEAALRYVQIRCLGMPAAVVIGTAQSACLGMQDVKSPLYVLAAAAGINFIGDMILVRNRNPWLGGAAGAAWATVLSQYGALFIFMKWLTVAKKETKHDNVENANNDVDVLSEDLDLTIKTSEEDKNRIKVTRGGNNTMPTVKSIRKTLFSSSKNTNNVEAKKPKSNAFARGFFAGKYKESDIFNIAELDKPTVKKFLPFVIPVTTTSIGRVSGYLAMSHVASSALGTLDMAAHQIAISIFCCLAPVVDALNQVAQSFVPGIFARKKSRERALALRNTSINFAKVGALFGAVIVGLVTFGVPFLSRFFTTDPMVLERVRNAIPGIAVFLGFDGLMCIGEGTLLGQNDLAFLRNMYASFFFIVPAFMFRLKHKALSGIPVGIGDLWSTFSVYEVVRTILWLLRVVQLQRRTEKEVAVVVVSEGEEASLSSA